MKSLGRLVPWCVFPAALLLMSCQTKKVDFQKSLQERLIGAKPGSVIDLPEGKYHLTETLSLMVDNVTIRGKGMDKTILSFAGQQGSGQGLLVKANGFTIEDVGIEDTAGDALTVQGGENTTIRRVRTEWTRGPNEANGPYGIYPVECKNLLLEDSVARGAADAGIYVGQCENAVIRRNKAEFNVDGYEIENCENVDAYDNISTHNVGGMGVFNLPNWQRQGGKHIRVFRNQIVDNNTANFAPKSLGPIHSLPSGTGMYIMAIRDVEVFNNKIQNNNTTNVYIIHYDTGVAEGVRETATSEATRVIFAPVDKRFYPFTQLVYLHDNDISGGGSSPDLRLETVKKFTTAAGGKMPDIVYDGLVDSKWTQKGANPGQVCLKNNGSATFINFNLASKAKHLDRDLKNYSCTLPSLSAVALPQAGPASSAGTGSSK
jgi:parallel beta-helix repeat protein